MADHKDKFLAPPVLAAIKNEEVAARVRMERTVSQEIRDERADLEEAAEQTLNVIVDLALDGTVRWVSPSWTDVVGTPVESIEGKPITNILLDSSGKNPFTSAVESMKQDDSKSQIIRFKIRLGPSSVYVHDPDLLVAQKEAEGISAEEVEDGEDGNTITLEGQGIMVYDRSSRGESHVSLDPASTTFRLTRPRPCGCCNPPLDPGKSPLIYQISWSSL